MVSWGSFMMLQHDVHPEEAERRRDSIYALFVELADVTDALTEKTKNDEYEELQLLAQRREECVRQLSERHTMEVSSMKIYGVNDERMKEIVTRVKQSSERMQSAMDEKNSMIVTALSNLQKQKMYQQ